MVLANMDALRRRDPFKFSDSTDEPLEDNKILDEQEQDELIQGLRGENSISNRKYIVVLHAILLLSFLLHLIYLFKSSKDSPILVLIPAPHPDPDPPIPLPTLFTLLSLYLHLNLALLLHPNEVRTRIDIEIRSLSYQLSYVLAAVAPALCIFLGRSWQTVAWWSLTGTVVFVTHTVQESINRGNESISELEAMRYVAPGA